MRHSEITVQMRGIAAAVSAAFIWGNLPLYIYFLDTSDPFEIVAHRALWSAVLLIIIVRMSTGFKPVFDALKTPGAWFGTITCCVMLSANWILFVYAVQSGQVVEAAFGYFIYPLVAVLLSILMLEEKLDKWGWSALALVLVGVTIKGLVVGSLPWLAIWLALTFGFYSIARKKFKIDPINGLLAESTVLVPPAVGYLAWIHISGAPLFFGGGVINLALAVIFGALTVAPLLLFHIGNRDLKIIMSSLLFYVNPTTQLLLGIYFFGGDFTLGDLFAFGFIWIGVIVYFSSRPRRKPPVHS